MRKEYDFSNAKIAKDVPHLSKLQAEAKDKTCVMIMLDNEVIQSFREKAKAEGLEYQTLINQTLMAMVPHSN
jgi:predicted DNA binding CopG/RHH family protein